MNHSFLNATELAVGVCLNVRDHIADEMATLVEYPNGFQCRAMFRLENERARLVVGDVHYLLRPWKAGDGEVLKWKDGGTKWTVEEVVKMFSPS